MSEGHEFEGREEIIKEIVEKLLSQDDLVLRKKALEKELDDLQANVTDLIGIKASIENDIVSARDTVNNKKAYFEGRVKKADELLNKVTEKSKGTENKLTEIETIHTEAKNIEQLLATLQTQCTEQKDSTLVTLETINEQLEELSIRKKTIDEDMSEFKNQYDDIEKLYVKLFLSKTDENGKLIRKAQSKEIDEYFDRIKDTSEQAQSITSANKKQFSQLKKELESDIRALLPDAGAAGLGSAYYLSKSRYGTSADKERKYYEVWKYLHLPTVFHYIVFLGPVGFFLWVVMSNGELINLSFRSFLGKLFLAAPLFYISYLGLKSINLNRRLYEEYNHKQRVLELYSSLSRELSTTKTKDELNTLLAMILQTVHEKPTIAMDKHDQNDKHIFDTLAQIIKDFFANIKSSKKTDI